MLVLASASPRRADMLRKLGLDFTQVATGLDEAMPLGTAPRDVVAQLAREKAEAAASAIREGWVLGADTLVFHAGEAIGKPAHAQDAARILERLQGQTHEVFTGLCVLQQPGGKVWQHVERSEVRLAPMSADLVRAYVATGEPLGKAGAYAVQGIAAAYVLDVRGPVDNVIGLPVRATLQLLARAGAPLPPHLRIGPQAQP